MRKAVVSIVIILGIAILVFLGWKFYNRGKDGSPNNGTPTTTDGTPTTTPETNAFRASGNIVRNNPGLKQNVWYLIHEQPGSPALTSELSFNNNSECVFGAMKLDCTKLQLNNGRRVEVQGEERDNIVTVRKLTVDTSDYIKVNSPKANDVIKSPMRITGEARGNWYFEASFPMRIVTVSGQTITSTFIQAKGEWMTENFVPFERTINFNVNTTTEAVLILSADNPSGLPEFDKEIRIPVTLVPANTPTRTVSLYFYNQSKDLGKDENVLCSRQGLERVQRTIPRTLSPLQDTIKLLLQGNLTEAEKNRGISTEFPLEGVALRSAVINNGVATLTFDDPNNRTGGGSCRVAILWAQIDETARQFPGIRQVRFLPEELFQP